MKTQSVIFYALATLALAQEHAVPSADVASVTPLAIKSDIRQAYCMQLPCVCGGCVVPEAKHHGCPDVKPSTLITTIVNTHTATSTSTSIEVDTSYSTYTTVVTAETRSTKTHVLYPEATHTKTHVESWLVWPEVSVRAPEVAGHTRTRARMQRFRPKETACCHEHVAPSACPSVTTTIAAPKKTTSPVTFEEAEATTAPEVATDGVNDTEQEKADSENTN